MLSMLVCSVCVLGRFASGAQAEGGGHDGDCGHAGRPWVSLVFAGEAWQRALRDSITADLRAGLRLRGIDVCSFGSEGSEPPVAMIELGPPSTDRVSVTIDVHDAITEKRVLRDVDLHDVTSDGRGLTLAQAAEELLRASWAELALEDAPKPAEPPPEEVTRAIAAVAHVSSPPGRALGARFAMEHHQGGQTLLGGDVLFGLWLGDRLGTELSIGMRKGLDVSAIHGHLESAAVSGTLAMFFALVPRNDRYDFLLKLGTQLLSLRLTGHAGADTTGSERSALSASLRASIAANAAISSALRLSVELGPGVPLRSVNATDGGHRVTSTSGVELHAALGLGAVF